MLLYFPFARITVIFGGGRKIEAVADNCLFLLNSQVEFNKAAQSLSEALVPSATKKAALSRLLKDNVALIVVLEARESGNTVDGQSATGKRGQLLCVVSRMH